MCDVQKKRACHALPANYKSKSNRESEPGGQETLDDMFAYNLDMSDSNGENNCYDINQKKSEELDAVVTSFTIFSFVL